MMKGTYKLSKPDELEATLIVTAKVSEFRALLEVIGDTRQWPMWEFRSVVHDVLMAAEKHFSAVPKEAGQ